MSRRRLNGNGWLCLIALGLLIAGGISWPQLQQSGGPGSTVTLLAGSAIAGKVGLDQTTPGTTNAVSLAQIGSTATATGNGVAGAGVQRVTIASDNSPVPVSGTFFQATQPVSGAFFQATQPVSIAATLATAPKTACGTTAFTPAWQAVPTSATALTGTTSCVLAMMFTNTNASAQTVTVTDGQGSPITVLQAFSIPPNSELTLPFYGSQMTTGIKWNAGGTGVTGTVVAYQ